MDQAKSTTVDGACVEPSPENALSVSTPINNMIRPIQAETFTHLKSDEEQLVDLVVLDDDSLSLLNDIKQEPKLDSPKDTKQSNGDASKLKVASTKSHSTPKRPSMNETIVLHLDTSDGLDCYIDTSIEQSPDEKPKNKIYSAAIDANASANKATESDSLILTADDELETELLIEKDEKVIDEGSTEQHKPKVETKKDNAAEEKKEPNKSNKGGAKKVAGVLWVSNITQSVKATDLKQHISKVGKVITAKVVTDGKKCYGYVVMENHDLASQCLKTLNNVYFGGRKISLSFTRPLKADKKKDTTANFEMDKSKLTRNISRHPSKETDNLKVSKTKEIVKRRPSQPRLNRPIKRRGSNDDPLTTKFDINLQKSRSIERKYQREKQECERLKRRLLEEQRRNREETLRHIQREEKHREMEFKLEQERRKLQLERELFEKERRELTRLDVERRKIEKERLEVLQQRTKLEEELQKSRMKLKSDEFVLNSTIVKPLEAKPYERQDAPKPDYRKSKFQKIVKEHDDRKMGDSKVHRLAPKPERSSKDQRDNKGLKRGEDFKSYERSAPPPPPKLDDFDIVGRKTKHIKHEYSEPKSYGDRKIERGGRKIEVIDRKFYPARSNEDSSERKHDRIFRKPEFEERKPHNFPERKYEYSRDTKRFRDESYSDRGDNTQRTQWQTPVSYSEPWKPAPSGPVSGSSTTRYQEGNFPTSPYGGPSRVPAFYYHPAPSAQEYPRYDHCPQPNARKY